MLLLLALQRADWDRVERYMLHEECESTTKVTRQEDKLKPGTGRDQDQGPEPGKKTHKYYYKDRRTASTANRRW